MAISDYLPEGSLTDAGEEMAKVVTKKILYPAAEKFVKDSANPYDDAALELVKAFLDGMIEDIHKEPEPEA